MTFHHLPSPLPDRMNIYHTGDQVKIVDASKDYSTCQGLAAVFWVMPLVRMRLVPSSFLHRSMLYASSWLSLNSFVAATTDKCFKDVAWFNIQMFDRIHGRPQCGFIINVCVQFITSDLVLASMARFHVLCSSNICNLVTQSFDASIADIV